MMPRHEDQGWALDVLRKSLRSSGLSQSLILKSAVSSGGGPTLPVDDPEKLEYVRELIQHILEGRQIIVTYNLVLLGILLLFSLWHIWQGKCAKRRWRHIEQSLNDNVISVAKDVEDDVNDAGSSSSSTLNAESDLERQPLLKGATDTSSKRPGQSKWFALLQSWLMYQPRPIPIINRSLPSNTTTLFVVAYISLNVFYHLYKTSFEPKHLFAFADRAGLIFVANLPLLYLLAAKNQPLKILTGRSYEALNIYHRRVGELMCFEALVHFGGILIWRTWIAPDWLMPEDFWHFITHPLVLLGIGAFASYELLYFTSLGSFRERWYELFLASHVFLQVAALLFLWLHFPFTRPFVYASLAIFILDRIVWRILLKSTTVTVDLDVLEDGETVWLSAELNLPAEKRQKIPWSFGHNVLRGWRPADHVFITAPSLGGSNELRAHPFTIASAAPRSSSDATVTGHPLQLLIRAQSGFTKELLQYAHENSSVRVRIDGPYGSQDPLGMLRVSTNAVLIAGGSGIAVVFPLVWDLAMAHRGKRTIHLLWILHSRSQRSWLPAEQLRRLRQAGVRVTIPEPTTEVGRPDVSAYVANVVAESQTAIGVVVSGPDGLNRSVRNASACQVRSGADISLSVEKFGW
ncbi:hypothetical protein F5Y16DRAFT_381388 [Xylariaceae sp. FL0255]|nr:hypothetical protein F5Y16DRAFT_381388 [Xylariaceae sp. FL0255]